jgi:sec-independent protein translocase protein TatB
MFDITSSKLLILAVVALIVVGPKDLPILLRTIGKYLGIIRRHAAEFRGQFDEAMREAELDGIKKEFDAVSREVRATIDEGARAIDSQIEAARVNVDAPKVGVSAAPAPTPALAAAETANETTALPPPEEAKEPGRGAA